MHAVIRTYSGSGAKSLFDLLEERKSDVDQMMRSIEGFASYLLVRTVDGGTTVTVCNDKAGTDESVVRARQWIAANASHLQAAGPIVSEGEVILHLDASDASSTASAIPLSTVS
jgi:hypothetical protein